MDSHSYAKALVEHYETVWANTGTPVQWERGPRGDLPPEFAILELPPTSDRTMWTYATVCMSQLADERLIELHLFAPQSSPDHVELLTAIAHYHRTEARLDLGHTVNFGREWIPGSLCDRGLVSLPYLDGPDLEILDLGEQIARCLWLIPITKWEVDYKKAHGLEALEAEFQKKQFNYLDPYRESVV